MDEFSNGPAIHNDKPALRLPDWRAGAHAVLLWLLVALASMYFYDALRARFDRSSADEAAFFEACWAEPYGAPVIFPNGRRVCFRTDHTRISVAGER